MKFTNKELKMIISALRFDAGMIRAHTNNWKVANKRDKLADKVEKELLK